MRIFKMIFGGLIIAIILGILGMYGREKLLLGIASYKLRNDVAELKKISFKDNISPCSGNISGIQLRFVSETEYVIEPACESNFDMEPMLTGKLMGGVRRSYGSGVMVKMADGVPIVDDAWVLLVYGDSQVAVGIFDGQAQVVWETEDLEIGGNSPAWGSCNDWGFSCCVMGTEVGEGTRVRTYDCTNNCYQVCNRLPVVLLFNTEPLLNPKTRTVVISKRDPIIQFGLEVSDDKELAEVKVDYGDGNMSPLLSAKTTDLIHEYQCNRSECYFKATVMAKDASGNTLVESSLNELTVVVR